MARAMKDSGVAWIGEIPQGWEIKRMKDCFISNNRCQPNNTVLSLSYGNVIVKDKEEKKGVTPESYESYQGVHPGDVIMRLTDLQNDQKSLRVGRATTKGIITSAYLCVSSRTLNDRYSAYLLHDVGDIQKLFYGLGGGVRQSMKFADLAELLFSLPPPPEQIAIADYLDRQTALIDQRLSTLAEKKAVLAELRKAIIHEAVTKGLNNTAPMKDSGVAWIGKIPQGWDVCTLKSVASVNDDVLNENVAAEAIIVYVDIGSVSADKGIDFTQTMVFGDAPSRARRLVKHGDVIVSTVRTYLRAIAPIIQPPSNLVVSTGFAVIRPRKKVVSEFIAYSLQDDIFMSEVTARSTGVSYPAINANELMSIQTVVPPKPEQRAIANHLDRQTALIDAQVATLDEQAQVLRELRKSIIHEAVTGKIDLSHYTPPPQAGLAA